MKINIFWFRRDLRLEDNTALNQALSQGIPVLPIFIFDHDILEELPKDDARVSFIHKQLNNINSELAQENSGILTFHGCVLNCFKNLLENFDIENVYANKDYEPYAIQRDIKTQELLKSKNSSLHLFKDQVIQEENEILKEDGKPYTVYTPYKNKWLKKVSQDNINTQKRPKNGKFYPEKQTILSLKTLGFTQSQIKVQKFSLKNLMDYNKTRDIPSLDSTSYLSPHLRFGIVSIRNIYLKVKTMNEQFVNELIWREFFMQILFHFPYVVQNNFRSKYDGIQWRNKEDEFKQWCNGETGYPMVDAGMRQLNKTGYMHNRVRMITAGFLCKHLLIDWKWGEAYFASKLLDYDLAANNGNWQWAAGTGCDAAPYFRIFNPTTQITKFDPKLKYIKKWVEDYNELTYPQPMVEHKFARERALETYKIGIL